MDTALYYGHSVRAGESCRRAGKGHAGKFQDFAGTGNAVSKHLQGTQAYY